MSETLTSQATPLEAKSPFELRVHLGENVPEADVRSALATGDMEHEQRYPRYRAEGHRRAT